VEQYVHADDDDDGTSAIRQTFRYSLDDDDEGGDDYIDEEEEEGDYDGGRFDDDDYGHTAMAGGSVGTVRGYSTEAPRTLLLRLRINPGALSTGRIK